MEPTKFQLMVTYWTYLVLLVTASVAHFVALRWAPNRAWALYHSIVGILGVIFTGLVIWLLTGRELVLRIWIALSIQAIVYPAVWIFPAILSIWRGQREHRAVHQLMEVVRKAEQITSDG